MSYSKTRVAILCGGQSAEHEVSLRSAKNIINALDKNKYDVCLITIDKKGEWHLDDPRKLLAATESDKLATVSDQGDHVALLPGKKHELFVDATHHTSLPEIDVVFPVLHGPYGEDGTVQGMLKLANIPFVGSDVLGSAICMDKDVMKRLLRDAGLPVSKFLVYRRSEITKLEFDHIAKELGVPFFVKPANLGSSVGISKVRAKHEFEKAINDAFAYDNKIIIEEFIPGREIECSVLGNDSLIASLPGEVIPHHEFYSYEAKYLDDNGASIEMPAKLPPAGIKHIQELSIEAFTTLCCNGMARVDFFYKNENEIFINEVNTIPGFTNISMYPQLWEISGISYSSLVEQLIQLAIENFNAQQQIKTSFELSFENQALEKSA